MRCSLGPERVAKRPNAAENKMMRRARADEADAAQDQDVRLRGRAVNGCLNEVTCGDAISASQTRRGSG